MRELRISRDEKFKQDTLIKITRGQPKQSIAIFLRYIKNKLNNI